MTAGHSHADGPGTAMGMAAAVAARATRATRATTIPPVPTRSC